jgi:hypothetical protein
MSKHTIIPALPGWHVAVYIHGLSECNGGWKNDLDLEPTLLGPRC